VSIYWQNLLNEPFWNNNNSFAAGKIIEEFKNGLICGLLTKEISKVSHIAKKVVSKFHQPYI